MLDRHSVTIATVTVATAVANSTEIDKGAYAGGFVFVPSGSSITTITWYAAEKTGGTYLAASDEDGTAITQTVSAGNAYELPKALYGARAIKPEGNAAGTISVSLIG